MNALHRATITILGLLLAALPFLSANGLTVVRKPTTVTVSPPVWDGANYDIQGSLGSITKCLNLRSVTATHGATTSPSTQTDVDGNFTVEVDAAFFSGGGTYTVTAAKKVIRKGSRKTICKAGTSDPQSTTVHLTVEILPQDLGWGTVVSKGSAINCGADGDVCDDDVPIGTWVGLAGVPEPGFTFDGWSGDCADAGTSTCVLVMHNAKAVGATFSLT